MVDLWWFVVKGSTSFILLSHGETNPLALPLSLSGLLMVNLLCEKALQKSKFSTNRFRLLLINHSGLVILLKYVVLCAFIVPSFCNVCLLHCIAGAGRNVVILLLLNKLLVLSLQIFFISILWAVAWPSIIIWIWTFDIQERKSIRPTFSAEGIYGGTLLAVRSNEFICFYDWAECRVVRRIDVVVKVKLAFCYTWHKLCISIILLLSPIPWLSRRFVDDIFHFIFLKFKSGMSSYIICFWWHWGLCYFFFSM